MNIINKIREHRLENALEKQLKQDHPELSPDQVKKIVLDAIDCLQEWSKNDKLDTILGKIEKGILHDRFKVVTFLISTLQNLTHHDHNS